MKLLRPGRGRALLVSGIGLVALCLAPATANAASPSIIFWLQMYNSCIDGSGPADSKVNVVWRSAIGALKSKGTTASDSDGYWEYCIPNDAKWIEPGDSLKVTVGAASRQYTAPNLTLAINRVSDVVSGTGPASRTIRVCPYWRFADNGRCHNVRVAPDGSWSWHEEFIEGAWVDVLWTSPNGDAVRIEAIAPSVAADLGKSTFSGTAGAPRGEVKVKINGGAKAVGHAIGDAEGSFSGQLFDASGHLVALAVGDRITASSIASNADFVMPNVSASADRFTELVTGMCGQGATATMDLDVSVRHSGHFHGLSVGVTNDQGEFEVDFNERAPFGGYTNIRSGDRITVGCYQTTGDVAQLKFIVP